MSSLAFILGTLVAILWSCCKLCPKCSSFFTFNITLPNPHPVLSHRLTLNINLFMNIYSVTLFLSCLSSSALLLSSSWIILYAFILCCHRSCCLCFREVKPVPAQARWALSWTALGSERTCSCTFSPSKVLESLAEPWVDLLQLLHAQQMHAQPQLVSTMFSSSFSLLWDSGRTS